MDRWTVDELFALVRRAANFADLTRDAFEGVLGMLAGAYPSDEFAELKPRVVWDRVTGIGRRPPRRARRGRHLRRHDPRPRPVRRLHGRGRRGRGARRRPAAGSAGGGSASSTRRWSTRPARAR